MCNLIIPAIVSNMTQLNEIISELKESNNFKGVDKKYEYFAYKNGEVLGKFKTLKEAEAISKITEKVWINQDEYNQSNILLAKIRMLLMIFYMKMLYIKWDTMKKTKTIKKLFLMY